MLKWTQMVCRSTACFLVAVAVACGDSSRSTGPETQPDPTYAGYPGFDIAVYPGDAALSAWRYPTSPYHWVGMYLEAPCHRDATWMTQYAKVTSLGWGSAVVYVGQQDWAAIPDLVPLSRRVAVGPSFDRSAQASMSAAVTCSASLLTTAQGAMEAADAVAKAVNAGVPAGNAIFLDIEYVTSVSPALVNYMSAWISGLLSDGRYRPAIYCAKFNASAVHDAAAAAYAAAGRTDAPRFWIASSQGFNISSAPTSVGLTYATVWQGLFDVSQSWGGSSLTIDIDVASTASPSAP